SGLDGHDRWQSRVRGLPETLGDLPATVLADEIETPGLGQIRAMVTLAGNPVLSVPNGKRLAAAFDKLDFMVSIDIYINETTRHADVILPPCWNLAEDHIDLLFASLAVRNIARWSPPVVERAEGELADWEILLELSERLGGGPKGGEDGLVLIGRRELRSNNSWMHNVPSLVSGRERCVLYVHPDDAARYEIRDGEMAVLESRVHRGEVRVAVTDEMRPGVVSLPHGWGHADSAPWQKVAGSHAGV